MQNAKYRHICQFLVEKVNKKKKIFRQLLKLEFLDKKHELHLKPCSYETSCVNMHLNLI